MLSKNIEKIINEMTPFVISNPSNLKEFNFDFWDKTQKDFLIFNPLKRETKIFWDLVRSVDQISFGEQGMAMENWVMFDCGAMPSAIVGFCLPKNLIGDDILGKLKNLPEGQEYIPISFYIAIPTVEKDHWFGHNLSSLNEYLPQKYPGLGLATKSLGIKVLKIKNMYGATQWTSGAINIHSQLGDMELLSAYTLVHTYPNSLSYKSTYNPDQLESTALSGDRRRASKYDFLLEFDDEEKIKQIQSDIESGKRFKICGRPEKVNGKTAYPIQLIR